MKDIVCYTEEEARKLGETLVKMGCPSFGPGVGMDLLRVVDGIDTILKNPKLGKEVRDVLMSLRGRFTDVCAVGAYMQGVVLKEMEKILGAS